MAGGGKKEKGQGLARALIRQRNKAAAAAGERGESPPFPPPRAAPLESVIDVSDIDAVLQRAVEADQLAESASVSSSTDLFIDL
jgi:large subunit GTPase 1